MPCIELSYYMTCKNIIAMVCLYFNAIKKARFYLKMFLFSSVSRQTKFPHVNIEWL